MKIPIVDLAVYKAKNKEDFSYKTKKISDSKEVLLVIKNEILPEDVGKPIELIVTKHYSWGHETYGLQ